MKKKAVINQEWPRELIMRLKEAQREKGYLSGEALRQMAESFNLPLHDVYGAATFYSFLRTKPAGRNVIRICRSLPCHMKDYEMVMDAVAGEIGIKPGQTTPDGRFSFELTNCIGLCDRSPAMLVNSDPHGDLTPQKIVKILRDYQ